MDEFKSMSPLFEEDILEALKIENCVNLRESYGGTGRKSIERQEAHASETIAASSPYGASSDTLKPNFVREKKSAL